MSVVDLFPHLYLLFYAGGMLGGIYFMLVVYEMYYKDKHVLERYGGNT